MADGSEEGRSGGNLIPATLLGTVLIGGIGGTGLVSGQGNLHEQVTTIRDEVMALRNAAGQEELRVMQAMQEVDKEAASRSRRVRDELQNEIEDLQRQIQELRLEMARMEAQ